MRCKGFWFCLLIISFESETLYQVITFFLSKVTECTVFFFVLKNCDHRVLLCNYPFGNRKYSYEGTHRNRQYL